MRVNRHEREQIKMFEDMGVRSAWDNVNEEWLYSIVDVVGLLTDQTERSGASSYWRKMKQRLNKEGSELATNCRQLKMKAADGRRYNTDVGNTKQIMRLIQSIHSPKVEILKLWLAEVGSERIDETTDPRQAIERVLEIYLRKGYSEEWIHQRMLSIKNALDYIDSITSEIEGWDF